MKQIAKAIAFASTLSLIGCAQTWVKPNARQGEFEQDRYACLQQSQQRVGAAQVNAYGGSAVNTVETNGLLFNSCMNSKGWSLQRQDVAQAQVQQQQFANQQRQDAQAQRNAEVKAAFDDYSKTSKENCAKPEFKEYYNKTACLAPDITFDQLADETKITKAQKTVLPKQRESIAERRKYFYELQIKYYGDLGRKRVDFSKSYLEPKEEANNLDLYNGKITWGQYNKARKEITADFTTKIKDIK